MRDTLSKRRLFRSARLVLGVVIVSAVTGGFALGYFVGRSGSSSFLQSLSGQAQSASVSDSGVHSGIRSPSGQIPPEQNPPAESMQPDVLPGSADRTPDKGETGQEVKSGLSKVAVGEVKTAYAERGSGAKTTVPPAAADRESALKQSPAKETDTQEAFEPAGASKAYTVQAGAFRNRKDAEKLKHKLEAKGYRVSIKKEPDANGEVFYKVKTGEFEQKKKASLLALKLKKAEGLNAFATPRN